MTTHLAARRGRGSRLVVLMALIATAVTLTAAAPAPASTTTARTTSHLAQGAGMGDHPNPAVRRVQRVLDRRGYDLGPAGVDGRFGPYTAAAVRRLQRDRGLAADGIVGPRTHRALGLRPAARDASRPTTADSGSTKAKGTTKAKAKPQPAPASDAFEGPAPEAPPRDAATGEDTTSTGVSWALAGLVALGIALAMYAVMALRGGRRRETPTAAPPASAPSVTPLDAELRLEGTSADEEVGAISGRALAVWVNPGPGNDPRAGDTHYLVDDPNKPAPVWVSARDVKRVPSRLAAGEPVLGYVTISADAPAHHADDPARAIGDAAERAGWTLVDVITDREAGRGLSRPGLTHALNLIAEGKARGLVVSDLRLLCRSTADLGTLMAWFRDAGAALVALDLGVDTSTPGGREVAATLATLGGWERERIARRGRTGLTQAGRRQPPPELQLPSLEEHRRR